MFQADPDDPPPPPKRPKPKARRRWARVSLSPVTLALIFAVNLLTLLVLGWPLLYSRFELPIAAAPWFLGEAATPKASFTPGPPSETPTPSDTPTPSNTPTPTDTPTPSNTPTPTDTPTPSATLPAFTPDPAAWEQGLLVLSLQEGLDAHLFVYQPLAQDSGAALPFLRITSGNWQDTNPALSPDGLQLAFASNRSGFWDLYLLNLASGEVTQVTNTPEYESSPSFSPDGLWLAYERYVDDNLEIMIAPIDGEQEAIQLTNHLGADTSPAWAPNGRQIAFVSTRGGRSHLWLADLDKTGEDRFVQLSRASETVARHPVWSGDGRFLAWAAVNNRGLQKLPFGIESRQPPRHGRLALAIGRPSARMGVCFSPRCKPRAKRIWQLTRWQGGGCCNCRPWPCREMFVAFSGGR